ncbi:MAG: hypothetical protein ACOZF0_13625 [Thermodesulfobacteriota bacterium]
MKRTISIALALCFIAALAVPVMALEIETTGGYRLRGFSYKNPTFNDEDKHSDDKYDHRLRMDHVLTIADNLKLSVRWTGFDNTWGTEVNRGYAEKGDYDTFILNRAFMTYVSPIGKFDIGRQLGGAWALPFGDYAGDFDRIKYTVPIGDKVAVIGILQKGTEGDFQTRNANMVPYSDADADVYYLVGNYKAEKFSTGILTAYVRNPINEARKQNYYAAVPYFNGTFGDITFMLEAVYEFGRFDDDRNGAINGNDMEIGAFTFGTELNGKHGAFGWETGYGHLQGQDARRLAGNDRKWTFANFAYGGLGQDWDKFVYLTDTSGTAILTNYCSNQGAVTVNPLAATSATMPALGGAHIWWLGASYMPKETLKLSVLGGAARAAEYDYNPLTGQAWQGADYGTELDFRLSWDITPNLNYAFNFGWLFVGDAMADVAGADQLIATGGAYVLDKNDLQDGCKIYHKIEVSF